MKNIKEKSEKIMEQLTQPLTIEEFEKFIYNVFCIGIFITPVFTDILGMGVYSLKTTIFNTITIITSISLLVINRKKLKINVYDALLCLYLLLVTLSTIFTENGIIGCILGTNGRGEGLVTIFSYVATFVIFSRGYKHMAEVSKVAIVAAIIVSIFSIIQGTVPNSVKLPFLSKKIEGMVGSTLGNPNFLSSYICIFLPMTCFWCINGRKKRKIAIVVAAMLLLSLLVTMTLGGYITVAVMYGIMSIFSIVYSKNKKTVIMRIIILTLVLAISFMSLNYKGGNKFGEEIAESKQEVEKLVNKDDEFAHNRLAIWKKSLLVIADYPILGIGPDSMMGVVNTKRYITDGAADYLYFRRLDKAHSEPLNIAVMTGIPSAIIYLIFIATIGIKLLIVALKKLKKKGIDNKEAQYITMVLICFASYLMQSLINISVIQVAPMFWAIVGTAAGIIENDKISTL